MRSAPAPPPPRRKEREARDLSSPARSCGPDVKNGTYDPRSATAGSRCTPAGYQIRPGCTSLQPPGTPGPQGTSRARDSSTTSMAPAAPSSPSGSFFTPFRAASSVVPSACSSTTPGPMQRSQDSFVRVNPPAATSPSQAHFFEVLFWRGLPWPVLIFLFGVSQTRDASSVDMVAEYDLSIQKQSQRGYNV